jgi:glyoxylase-like metal-dependent hydrolase (beta-lactamase superfamily II)
MVASGRITAPLYCHEKDRESVAERTPVHETFASRHVLDDDFEVIPTPGHTRGATAFLWGSGGHRFLFTSDTIYLREGEWVATVLGESDRKSYIESLELIRDLDFDVLVPWAATRGQPCYAATDKSAARRRIGAILDRVRRGEDH